MTFPVLLIEDSAPMRTALEDLFATIPGVEIVGVADTEMEAMEWLNTHEGKWSLAVVDLLLAEGTGFHLLPRLRAQPSAGRIVVLSDFATEAVARRCRELGADAVFTKSDTTRFAECVACYARCLDGAECECECS